MDSSKVATQSNGVPASEMVNVDSVQRRLFPSWPQKDMRPVTPTSDDSLTPPSIMWRGGRRNSDAGPYGPGVENGLGSPSSIIAGRRRANSDLDRSLAPSPDSVDAAMQFSASGDLMTAIGSRRDRDPKKSALYKTELCRSYEETGHCRYGTKCQFAHGGDELRQVQRHPKYKTEICRTFWEKGTCPYGKRCCFIHNEGPGGIQQSANGSSASLVSDPTGELLLPTTSTETSIALAASLSALTLNSAHSNGDDSSHTSSVSSSPILAAMQPGTAVSSGFSEPALATGATFLGVSTTVGYPSSAASQPAGGVLDFPFNDASAKQPTVTASRLPDPVTLTSWPGLSAADSYASSPCLLSSDLLSQLDLRTEYKPQRPRAWTIDASEDSIRYPGASHANIRLGTSFPADSGTPRSSPGLLPVNTSLLTASPALSAASLQSVGGIAGPVTPPVLGPIGGVVPATGSSDSLPLPVLATLGASTARSTVGGRPRSASVGTTGAPMTSAPMHPHYQVHGPYNAAALAAPTTGATATAPAATPEQRRLPVFRRLGHS